MTVQREENWTEISGEIVDFRPSTLRKGFVEVEILVKATKPVEDFADFLSDSVDKAIVVNFRAPSLEGHELAKGVHITVLTRIGRKPDQVFAHTQKFTIG